MKILLYFISFLFTANVAGAVPRQTVPDSAFFHPRVSVALERVTLADDSVTITLSVSTRALRLSRKAAVTIIPLLTADGKEHPFPSVIIAGQRRARLDSREKALSRLPKRIFRELRLRRGHDVALRYTATVPYSPWMRDATLAIRYLTSECLADEILGVQTVMPDVSLPDEYSILSGELEAMSDSLRSAREEIRQLVVLKERLLDSLARQADNTCRGTMYLAYPAGRTPLLPDFGDNRRELARVDSVLRPLLADTTVTIRSVTLTGYASPEGTYDHNARLAERRVCNVLKYLCRAYPGIDQTLFRAYSVAEDWEGTVRLLQASDKPYKQEVLQIIRECNIFDGREQRLIRLRDGNPYRDMLKDIFPRLRRTEFVIEWEKQNKTKLKMENGK